MVERGKIFVKPSEEPAARRIAERTGAEVVVLREGPALRDIPTRLGGVAPLPTTREEQEKRAAEQARLKKEGRRIEQETITDIRALNKRFTQTIRGMTDRNLRLAFQKQLNLDMDAIKLKAGAEKVKAGIITSFTSKDVKVTKGNVEDVLKKLSIEKREVPQIGKPIITEKEASKFTEEQKKRVTIIPSGVTTIKQAIRFGRQIFPSIIPKEEQVSPISIKERLKQLVVQPKGIIGEKFPGVRIFFNKLNNLTNKVLKSRNRKFTDNELKQIINQFSGNTSVVDFEGFQFSIKDGQLVSQGKLPLKLQEFVNLVNNPNSPESILISSGNKFNPFAPSFFMANQTIKLIERTYGEGSIEKFEEKLPNFLKNQKVLGVLSSLTATIPFFAFFDPVFRTATTAQEIAIQKTTKKITEGRFDALSKVFEDNFKKGDKKQIVTDLNKIVKMIKDQPDEVLKSNGIKNLERLLKDLNIKKILPDFAFNTQTGAIAPLTAQAPNVAKVDLIVDFLSVGVPQIKGVTTLFAAGVTKIPEIKKEVKLEAIKESSIISQSKKQAKLSLGEKYKLSQIGLTKTKQKQITLQKTRQKQLMLQRTIPKTKAQQRQVSALAFKQAPLLKQKAKFGRPTAPIRSKLFKKIKPRVIVPLLPSTRLKRRQRLKKSLAPISRAGYNTFVRSRGKFFKANINPLSKKHSKSLGSWLVDRSLSAQFKIKKTSKKAQRPKLIFPLNYGQAVRRKFRGKIIKGKEQPIKNKYFERKRHRLDTPREVRKIQVAKLHSEMKKKVLKRLPKPFTLNKNKKKKKKKGDLNA